MNSANCIEKYLNKMKKIQYELIKAFDAKKDKDLPDQELIFILKQLKIISDRHIFKSFLHLLAKMYENRHQQPDNIKIIENIISYFKKDILKHFQNCEIYTIFKNDKKLLLFLLKSEILKIDKFVIKRMKEKENSSYFFPEVKDFLENNDRAEISKKIPDNFIEKRHIGENDSNLSEIIRNDSIDKFVSYISKTNIPLKSIIDESIFETNTFLIENKPTLIEYAAFFGSIQIFQYLLLNKVALTESLWLYAIHSQNTEILSILEENNIKPNKKTAIKYFNESIQCHQNEIADYINENYIKNNEEDISTISQSIYFKSYNFIYIKSDFINQSNFLNFCCFDYPLFVEIVMKTINIEDINAKTIFEKEYNGLIYNNEQSALSLAISNHNNEVAKILLTNENIDINCVYKSVVIIPFSQYDVFKLFVIMFLITFVLSLYSYLYISFSIASLTFIILTFLYDINAKIKTPLSIYVFSNISTISLKSIKYVFEQYTVLHQAIIGVNIEIVDILSSKQNIDINAIYNFTTDNNYESTALNFAIENNYNEIAKILLENPNINVNAQSKKMYYREINSLLVSISMILLFISTKPSFIFIFMMLVDQIMANRNVILKIFFFSTIIGIIIFFMSKTFLPNLFDTILSLSAKIYLFLMSIPYLYILNIVEKANVVYIISELLSSLLYIQYTIKYPLHTAIEQNNVEIAKILLSNKNIDINSLKKSCCHKFKDNSFSTYSFKIYEEIYTNKTALNMAVEQNNAEIVKLILENVNVDINFQCISTTNKRIIILNNISIVLHSIESIICKIYSFHSKKSSLNIAIEKYNIEIVKQLLEKSQIGIVINEYKKLQHQQNKKILLIKNDNGRINNDDQNKLNEILEILQKFISNTK